ncbi:PEPxxWA-CTERM sorting domain-containing protein [Parapontixanthobacter aurantiacus]|uniref:PEPxxWA-CTERM sorting domain-containing protein n=1 Tax=Parapontixanthobacter aurantiacus TaxID=1463599 RepID=UPI001F487726|nr:PEPxxWA-CTERM sorting domain-containing protein [Parapontixanthobacter aurantiacus]
MENVWASIRNRKWAVGAIAAIVLLAGALTLYNNNPFSSTSPLADDAAQADRSFVERVTDTINALIGRSPGERTEARLMKTKGGAIPALRRVPRPTQRALGKVFEEPVGPSRFVPEDQGLDPAIVLPPEDVLAQAAPSGAFPPVGGPGLGGAPIPIIPGGGGGGGVISPPGPGGPGGPGVPPIVNPPVPPVIPPVVPPAVPEPSTWAMLLLGMAAVGGMMRRRPRASTSGEATGSTNTSCGLSCAA